MNRDIKSDYPEMPEGFDSRILKKTQSVDEKRVRFPGKTAVIAAAAVLLIGLTVFAAAKVLGEFFSRTAEHQMVMTEENSEVILPVVPVRLERTFLPENVVPDAVNKTGFLVRDASGQDEGCQFFYDGLSRLSGDDKTYSWVENVRYERFGEHDGAVVYKQDIGFEGDRLLFIRFPEFGLLYQAYVPSFVSDDDLRLIAEGIRLIETEPDLADPLCDNDLFSDRNLALPEDESGPEPVFAGASPGSELTDFQTGVSYRISGARIIDSVDGLDKDHLTLWDGLIAPDGTFPRYDREEFAIGDGVHTLTEKTGVTNVGRRVLMLEITATNTAGTETSDWLNKVIGGSDETTLMKNTDKLNYALFYDGGHTGDDARFGTITLAPGETKTVTVGYMFDDDLPVGELYFGVNTDYNVCTCIPVFAEGED